MERVASTRETEEISPLVSPPSSVSCKSYNHFRSEVEKPFSERKKMNVGRGNKDVTMRKYHLKAEERAELMAEAASTGGTVNPLKGRVGAYWGQVEALIQLGINEFHSLKSISKKMESIMTQIPKSKTVGGQSIETTLWNDFYEKRSRDGASKPRDGMGRIEQNFKVLQRLPRPGKKEKNPYGLKLAQFGMTIDIEYREIGEGIWLPYICLNTKHAADDEGETITPLYKNPGGRRRKKAKATLSAEKKEMPEITELKSSVTEITEVISSAIPPVSSPPEVKEQETIKASMAEEGIMIPNDALNDFEAQQTQQAATAG